jgi:PTH1 family peptidyl-tRNA hydrolase
MAGIRLIAGLGNPGRKHERDRHNVGFWFVSRLADKLGLEMRSQPKYHGLVGKTGSAGTELWLVMPQTYMNASGMSVGALARFYKVQPDECLMVHDELDFPPGVARLKRGGGVGGHNGLRDVAEQLGTPDYWRLRMGIGHPGDKNVVADYVLSSPPPAERELIESAIERCLEHSSLLIAGDMREAMLRIHTKDKPEKPEKPDKGAPDGTSGERAGG